MSVRRDPDGVLAAWLRSEAHAGAPDRLLSATRTQLESTPQRQSWWPVWRYRDTNTALKLAIATAAVVVVAVALTGITLGPKTAGVGGSPGERTPSPTTTPTPSPTTAVTPSSTPSAARSEVDRGWLTGFSNPSGRYSWDPDGRAAQENQPQPGEVGWMSHDESHIIITMSASDGGYGPGPTTTKVGGYTATYQEVPVKQGDPLKHPDCGGDLCIQRVWIVDINGTPVTIIVDPNPRATAADLVEATTVIDSIRVERTSSRRGFKVSFDLVAGWGSR
jgi:hypothetical protein